MALAIFTVGQSVLVTIRVRHGRNEDEAPHPTTVAKIGRKWVTLATPRHQPFRFSLDDVDSAPGRDADNDGPYWIDGGDYFSPGFVWRDQAHMDRYRRREAAWARLTAKARERSTMPGHLPVEAIEAIAGMLEGPGK